MLPPHGVWVTAALLLESVYFYRRLFASSTITDYTKPHHFVSTIVIFVEDMLWSSAYILVEMASRDFLMFCRIVLPSGYQDGVHCLSFKYNMHGWHINKLQVDKRTASGQEVNLWTKERRQGPEWHAGHVQVDLRSTDQVSITVDMSSSELS